MMGDFRELFSLQIGAMLTSFARAFGVLAAFELFMTLHGSSVGALLLVIGAK